jgi:ABC-type amino acid transport substrate-binding protein
MKCVRKIGLLALFVATLLAVSGCGISKIRQIRVTSVGVKYVVPTSSRSVDGVLLLGLDNPSISFTAQDVQGVVKSYGRELARFTAGELPVQARSVQVYELPCTAALSEKVSLLDLLAFASKRSMEGMTVDVKLRVSLGRGKGTVLTFNDIDLSQFSQ